MKTAPLAIQYRALKSLKKWAKNPKQHDLGALHQSLERFGFVNPIIVNERTGQVVAGHGRLEALMQRAASGGPMPDRIKRSGTDWLVPVLVVDMDEREADAYAVADNRIVELGGWNESMLAEVLSGLALEDGLGGIGYDQDDLDAMLDSLGVRAIPPSLANVDISRPPEMIWVLFGIPTTQYGASAELIDMVRNTPGVFSDSTIGKTP